MLDIFLDYYKKYLDVFLDVIICRHVSNLGCRTQFALEGCSKTDLFENRNIRNSENEINLFCTPKEYSETSVSEELGVRVIRLSNKLRARIT